jgi:heme exporter protein C
MAPTAPSSRQDGNARRRARDVSWLAGGLAGAGLAAAVLVAPADAVQGDVQRLMYLHVPAAWTAYLAFAAVALNGVAYLLRGDPRFDRRARAAAEVGVACTAVALVVGAVWGRAVWGVWWTWDPRLLATALLLLVYAGSLAVRLVPADPARGARAAALVGVAGFGLVPVVHFSVVWWRSLHQPATVLGPRLPPPIDPLMAATLLLCVAAAVTVAVRAYLWRVSSPLPVPTAPGGAPRGVHGLPPVPVACPSAEPAGPAEHAGRLVGPGGRR